MRYYQNEQRLLGVNNSRPGGREESHRIIQEKNGKIKVLATYPTFDLASKMYQTHKHDMRLHAKKKNVSTVLKLQSVRKFSANDNGIWDIETYQTKKSTTIAPYSKSYAHRLKNLME